MGVSVVIAESTLSPARRLPGGELLPRPPAPCSLPIRDKASPPSFFPGTQDPNEIQAEKSRLSRRMVSQGAGRSFLKGAKFPSNPPPGAPPALLRQRSLTQVLSGSSEMHRTGRRTGCPSWARAGPSERTEPPDPAGGPVTRRRARRPHSPGYLPPRLLLMKQTMSRISTRRATAHMSPMNQPWVAMSAWLLV